MQLIYHEVDCNIIYMSNESGNDNNGVRVLRHLNNYIFIHIRVYVFFYRIPGFYK